MIDVYRTFSIKRKIFLATKLHPTLSDILWDEVAVASLHSAGLAMLELAQSEPAQEEVAVKVLACRSLAD